MAIKINLLMKEYAPPRRTGSLEWAIAAAVAVAVVAGSVFYMGVAAQASEFSAKAAQREQDLHRVKAQLAEAANIRVREDRVAQAEGELKGLQGRRWSNVLLTLRDLTPQHVTWRQLDIAGDKLTLQATSQGLIDVAQLFGGLIVSSHVAEVQLRYVNEMGIELEYTAKAGESAVLPDEEIQVRGSVSMLAFELEITLKPQEGGVPVGAESA